MVNNKFELLWRDISPLTVGFDRTFDTLSLLANSKQTSNYPPYNIVKTGSLSYDSEVALAGDSKKDVSVNYEDNILKIESVKSKEEKEGEDKDGVLHKGIAKRSFMKSFTIADDVEVKGAELKDGLLKVSLEKIVPDHKKARTINIK